MHKSLSCERKCYSSDAETVKNDPIRYRSPLYGQSLYMSCLHRASLQRARVFSLYM